MNGTSQKQRSLLQNIARRAMTERGLLPDFSAAVLAETEGIEAPATANHEHQIQDLRELLWVSIDNDDSRDLDQLTVIQAMTDGTVKILVAIADVDSLVNHRSAIDEHAYHNTTSVYTAAEIFPMLPEKLSTDFTSLNPNEDRLAIVIEMIVGEDGSLEGSDIYRALVCNHAKLAYNSVAAWLEGDGSAPEVIATLKGLEGNLRNQDRVAQRMKNYRHLQGALSLETIEARPIFDNDEIRDLEKEEKNRAKEIIEDFMIAANGVTARYLLSKNFPSIRRVVRTPKRWERIVELANERGFQLPENPDVKILESFLNRERAADPVRFPDLSLAVIKLLGAGEYVAEIPGQPVPGHFGLAFKDYTHSTAPNRRYPDLVTQRLLKAAIEGRAAPYDYDELSVMARHFTNQEDAANKVERQVGKSAAALLLQEKIGQKFDAVVTGASDKGTWARLLDIPVEGRVEEGFEDLDVGDRVRLQLISVNVERGFIDFRKVGSVKP